VYYPNIYRNDVKTNGRISRLRSEGFKGSNPFFGTNYILNTKKAL